MRAWKTENRDDGMGSGVATWQLHLGDPVEQGLSPFKGLGVTRLLRLQNTQTPFQLSYEIQYRLILCF